MTRSLLIALAALPLTGCGAVMLGSTLYGNAQYDKQVKAGTAPPTSLVRECQLGTSGQEQIECFRQHGWRYEVGPGWSRIDQ